jgi:hypothetical protein
MPPNRVRYPADQSLASGCSPPRLTTTQLPLATELWFSPTRTCTALIWRLRGHTTKPLRGSFPPITYTPSVIDNTSVQAHVGLSTQERNGGAHTPAAYPRAAQSARGLTNSRSLSQPQAPHVAGDLLRMRIACQ